MSRITVLGGGAWGTAIALSLARRGGHELTLWTRSEEVAAAIHAARENTGFLPGFAIPESVAVTTDPELAIVPAEIVVSVMPSHHVRASYQGFAPYLRAEQVLVSATKGIEDGSYLRVSQIIGEVLAQHKLDLPVAVLSGPSFAQEVAAGSPTAVAIACADQAVATRIQREFSSGTLRLYTNDDVIGVELGGALKNVIAIAAGVVSGLGLGHNSMAALVTRGIAEVTRLATACGGRRETLSGLSGLGDLVLTCTGALSRNRWVGVELGQGKSLPAILEALQGKVAEGVRTTTAALGLAQKHGVELPIADQVAAILQGKSPVEAMQQLMVRPGRDE
ncbi:glycerol-3-phosphate dehydrogenase (NAD(P)+) [Silvibacterium bohemicum]|uniref:Glycerol-3-phosphate dehydrogenase [NAD(P)+] n=1 Tax=Silvibacterium bohemicum TaxID=1577686 RepID=A0A841JUS8_9BACT|nr:NAD(P)H-dependent glycerol-3-phosphate dehydrogenase [Silvibacterium bohemicum]MBB6142178.1 glycerol-3-phosphate dehydrogenase (NAD(P)+) [Silvibacterium bohemicum]